jgi:hypothetical protein
MTGIDEPGEYFDDMEDDGPPWVESWRTFGCGGSGGSGGSGYYARRRTLVSVGGYIEAEPDHLAALFGVDTPARRKQFDELQPSP